VVVADVGGTAEWSEAGCIVVAPGSVDEMAEAVARLAADGDLAARLGLAGRALVRERFARDPIEARLVEVYAEASSRHLHT